MSRIVGTERLEKAGTGGRGRSCTDHIGRQQTGFRSKLLVLFHQCRSMVVVQGHCRRRQMLLTQPVVVVVVPGGHFGRVDLFSQGGQFGISTRPFGELWLGLQIVIILIVTEILRIVIIIVVIIILVGVTGRARLFHVTPLTFIPWRIRVGIVIIIL